MGATKALRRVKQKRTGLNAAHMTRHLEDASLGSTPDSFGMLLLLEACRRLEDLAANVKSEHGCPAAKSLLRRSGTGRRKRSVHSPCNGLQPVATSLLKGPKQEVLLEQVEVTMASVPRAAAPQSPAQYLPKKKGRQELHGPCCHCGALCSPQWRKGPTCKPVLCNACGTRFLRTRTLGKVTRSRKRGSLDVPGTVGSGESESELMDVPDPKRLHRSRLSPFPESGPVKRARTARYSPASVALPRNFGENSKTSSSTSTAEPQLGGTAQQLQCTAHSGEMKAAIPPPIDINTSANNAATEPVTNPSIASVKALIGTKPHASSSNVKPGQQESTIHTANTATSAISRARPPRASRHQDTAVVTALPKVLAVAPACTLQTAANSQLQHTMATTDAKKEDVEQATTDATCTQDVKQAVCQEHATPVAPVTMADEMALGAVIDAATEVMAAADLPAVHPPSSTVVPTKAAQRGRLVPKTPAQRSGLLLVKQMLADTHMAADKQAPAEFGAHVQCATVIVPGPPAQQSVQLPLACGYSVMQCASMGEGHAHLNQSDHHHVIMAEYQHNTVVQVEKLEFRVGGMEDSGTYQNARLSMAEPHVQLPDMDGEEGDLQTSDGAEEVVLHDLAQHVAAHMSHLAEEVAALPGLAPQLIQQAAEQLLPSFQSFNMGLEDSAACHSPVLTVAPLVLAMPQDMVTEDFSKGFSTGISNEVILAPTWIPRKASSGPSRSLFGRASHGQGEEGGV